jgi:hypothetical protein
MLSWILTLRTGLDISLSQKVASLQWVQPVFKIHLTQLNQRMQSFRFLNDFYKHKRVTNIIHLIG